MSEKQKTNWKTRYSEPYPGSKVRVIGCIKGSIESLPWNIGDILTLREMINIDFDGRGYWWKTEEFPRAHILNTEFEML